MLTDKALQEEHEDFNGPRFDEEREAKAEFRETVETSFGAGKADADDESDYEQSRPYLEEFETRYGRPAHETLRELIEIEAQIRTNPEAGGEALADWYFRNGQQVAGEKPKATTTHPEGSIGAELEKAFAQTKKDAGQRDAIRELQKIARERGAQSFSAFLKGFTQLDRQLAKDPRYHAARIAAQYGMPTPASEGAERAQVERYLHGRVDEVRALWASGAMRSTGDTAADLRATAMELQQRDREEAQKAIAAELAAFKAKHKDFDSVRDDMSKLMKAGKAKTLEDAYAQVKRGGTIRGALQNEFARSRA